MLPESTSPGRADVSVCALDGRGAAVASVGPAASHQPEGRERQRLVLAQGLEQGGGQVPARVAAAHCALSTISEQCSARPDGAHGAGAVPLAAGRRAYRRLGLIDSGTLSSTARRLRHCIALSRCRQFQPRCRASCVYSCPLPLRVSSIRPRPRRSVPATPRQAHPRLSAAVTILLSVSATATIC